LPDRESAPGLRNSGADLRGNRPSRGRRRSGTGKYTEIGSRI